MNTHEPEFISVKRLLISVGSVVTVGASFFFAHEQGKLIEQNQELQQAIEEATHAARIAARRNRQAPPIRLAPVFDPGIDHDRRLLMRPFLNKQGQVSCDCPMCRRLRELKR